MKVELDDIVLGCSPLTGNVFAGIPLKDGETWRHKKEVTQSFLNCVISKWEDSSEIIQAGENKWEITVKKISTKATNDESAAP
jgi:hypothetical protein